MFMMNCLFGVVLVFLVFSVMVLVVTSATYQGVIALMGVSFSCCMLMVVLGRTFAALVMYIVYLGGLIVVFGYCISIEKDKRDVFKADQLKYFVMLLFSGFIVFLWWVSVGGLGGLLVYPEWEGLVCLEVNGSSVFYFEGGAGLVVCSWGLLMVLFSILVVLSWSRLGGLRPF